MKQKEFEYFSYDPDNGFETWQTEEDAKKAALESIDYYRDYACDGWNEEVGGVCWGKIKQESVITDRKTIKEAKEDLGVVLDDANVSCYVDYGLRDT